ncbi:MAG TPA: adenylate/guanylate cyclase domain-containing protein [Casimicrobiaceae bacterium]|nr:adenylate/guanylate cyclase domain-containing protein [Casimicrobiaceae bacterium]
MENHGPSSTPPGDAAAEACARIRKHLEQGAPWAACDLFREEVAKYPAHPALLYWGALAHARSGAWKRAHALLDQAEAAGNGRDYQADILSLRGRLWKDAYQRAPDAPDAPAIAERARQEYLAAYRLAHEVYPAINAASLSLLLGDRASALELAQEIVARLTGQASPRTSWDHATLGEARLALGEFEEAGQSYASAYAESAGDAGSVATMRRQLQLLSRAIPQAAQTLRRLPAPDIVAFAGHMIDAPDRAAPRFPPALVPAVRAAVRDHVARLNTPIVYTSAACGADLIFIEAALEAGAEVNVVLPFDREDFVRTSVAIGGDEWVERFDAALSRATRVIMATDEHYLGDDVLFEQAAMLLEGLSILRGAQLQTIPSMYCVIDAAAPGRVGGTQASFDRWTRHVGPPQMLDLAEMRTNAAPDGSTVAPVAQRPAQPPPGKTEPHAGDSAPTGATRPQRSLKTLLFADFAGFSRVHDAAAPFFQESFWKIAASQIAASPVKPLLASTWGDALYVVFDAPRTGAAFALSFLENMLEVDWAALGLSEASPIRIALHAGPVFCGFDPIIGRDNYFGSSVTKAARIEPVTPPGMVYASEAFAATLAATGCAEFSLEYVGRTALAKGYGESRIYRLDRR